VYPKDLTGAWRLVIDVEGQGDSDLGRALLKSVQGLLAKIDVRFVFENDNELSVHVNVFGEEEIEHTTWRINERGELILGDSDHVDMDETVWLFKDGRLAAYEYDDGERVEDAEGAYLERIE
jgi:hypothetical protein